ncbi:hypothetical protein [Halobacteriovorax sp. HLS]|uniref:hypothetical protein n=1 Tax=Halobacteriovorax sp. HLS TaxID=2234000 RepID=UPI000FD7AFDA|nr:hypothetical protein [Halobacteriovorax sp. HLS]
MNDLIEKIDLAYNENKFREALRLIEEFLNSNFLSTSQHCELLETIFQCQPDLQFSLRDLYLEKSLEQNFKRIKFLEDTLCKLSKNQKIHIYKNAKRIYLSLGKLEKLENLFSSIKSEFLKYKSYSLLLEEVENLEREGLEDLLTDKERMEINYGLFNIDYFKKLYERSLQEGSSPLSYSKSAVDFSNDIWRKQTFAVKEKVISNSKFYNIEEAKEFLKGIYELLIVDSETAYVLKYLLHYCKVFGNMPLAQASFSLLTKESKDTFGWSENDIKNIPRVERADFEQIDLGEDLFASDGKEKELTIQRLVNQIQLLNNQDDLAGVTKLLKQLRELDEEHSLVKELGEREHGKLGSKLKTYKKSITEIQEQLFKELGRYSSEEISNSQEIDHLERVSKKFIELSQKEFLTKNYNNLIYTFNTLGFYKVSIKLINILLIDSEDISIKFKVELVYLKCETLIMSKNLYGALNEIEEFLEQEPLTQKEKINFWYLKAEVLRMLGNKREALKVYSKVFKINKNYRMVSDRLKEIE